MVKSRARTTTASVSRQTSVAVEHQRQDGSTSQTPSVPPFSAASRSETQLSNAEPHPILLQATPVLANTISRGLDNILETQISSFQVVPSAIPIVTPAPARPTPTPILLGPRPTRPLEINSVYHSLPHEERRSQAPPTIHSTPSQSIPIVVSNNAPPDGPPPIGDPTVPPPLTNSNSVDTLNPSHSQEAEAAPRSRRRQRSQDGNSKRARKRRASNSGDEENVPERSTSRQRRSRASSSTPRPRKRAPSPPPYDPDADPGEDIDPTTMTMAELCADTGQGRVSAKAAEIQTNHTAWKVKNREKRARMRMMMEAKKYGRPDEDDADDNPDAIEPNEETSSSSAPLAGPSTALSSAPAVVDDSGSGFDYSQDLSTSRYNVQVRIGPNGETIIDEESLVVDRVDNDGTQDYTHIVESDHTKFINSATYGKRYRGSRWSAEETELFYDVRRIIFATLTDANTYIRLLLNTEKITS